MLHLHWNTVTNLLGQVLRTTMNEPIFDPFRLVGDTALSLQLGHRKSVDIDLFTDQDYGSVDFDQLHSFLKKHFSYVSNNSGLEIAMGTSYFVGKTEEEAIKIDLYYTDKFIRPLIEEKGIRLASMEDIAAMKMEIISEGGRKKDFWDLHELIDYYSIEDMINFHKERYPYGHDKQLISQGLIDFSFANDDFDPICLNGKHWELIKLDFVKWMESL